MPGWISLVLRRAAVLLEPISPSRCVACHTLAGVSEPLCVRCAASLRAPRRASVAGVPIAAAAVYRPPITTALHRLKYGGRPDVASALARLMLPAIDSLGLDPFVLVPVPLATRRLVERGYNQAALLAAALSKMGPWTWAPRGLVRSHWVRPQVGLTYQMRQNNSRGNWAVPDPRAMGSRPVVLVDDVVTTGATAYSCIRALRAVDASVVAIATVARAGLQSGELVGRP